MATPIPANRARLDAASAAAQTGGRIVRSSGLEAIGITTDSRVVARGNAFVALRGMAIDGHEHQRAAVDAGAVLLVAERGRALDDARADAVEVDDTLVAWGRIARAHLRAWRASTDGRIVAITGSAGKTTTKELCAALLAEVGPVWAAPGNLNNLVGLPAAALCVDTSHRFVVLEAGMSVPGEIERLGAICEPDVGVITNVGLAHAGGVGGTREGVAREKGALFAAVLDGGTCVAPIDDPLAMGQLGRARPGRVTTFGRAAGEYRMRDRIASQAGAHLTVERSHGSIDVDLPLAGEAAALDFLAALAAAEAAARRALDAIEIARALGKVVVPPGRADIVRLADGTVIIDDSYNANPSSMRAAFATLAEIGRDKRKVAVLGEMRELGGAADGEHAALGDAIDANVVIGCGGLVAHTLERAKARGIEVHAANDAQSAAAVALRVVRPGDVVLVKGSRGVTTEIVVSSLKGRG